jgi:hypothetical protein
VSSDKVATLGECGWGGARLCRGPGGVPQIFFFLFGEGRGGELTSLFIMLEGGEGTGKSTVAAELARLCGGLGVTAMVGVERGHHILPT